MGHLNLGAWLKPDDRERGEQNLGFRVSQHSLLYLAIALSNEFGFRIPLGPLKKQAVDICAVRRSLRLLVRSLCSKR
jgi:hypothetical protein